MEKSFAETDLQLFPNQILIGSIPIELHSSTTTRVAVRNTSAKEDEGNLQSAPKLNVLMIPRQIELNSSSRQLTKALNSKNQEIGVDSTTKSNQKRVKPRGNKGFLSTPEAAMSPLLAFGAEKSQNAKSYMGRKKCALKFGCLLTKEFQHGDPNTQPWPQFMDESPYKESSISSKEDEDSEDEKNQRKKAQKKGKSFQQILKERYEAGDPEVGLLGESSGKFDFYVLYPRPKIHEVSPQDLPPPSWDDPPLPCTSSAQLIQPMATFCNVTSS